MRDFQKFYKVNTYNQRKMLISKSFAQLSSGSPIFDLKTLNEEIRYRKNRIEFSSSVLFKIKLTYEK